MNQDLLFPLLPKPGPVITPGVEILHVRKIAKKQRIKPKAQRDMDNKFDNMQRFLGKQPESTTADDEEHQIDLFV